MNPIPPNYTSATLPQLTQHQGAVMNKLSTTTTTISHHRFQCPRRPNYGTEGRPILLRANLFKVSIPSGVIHRYLVEIQPDSCPRSVNRKVVDTLVSTRNLFANYLPVYDGRKSMYTRERLPIDANCFKDEVVIPNEGLIVGRKFAVTIQWASAVSLAELEKALAGHTRMLPMEAVQAVDVILRHLPAMRYIPVGRSFFHPSPSLDAAALVPLGQRQAIGGRPSTTANRSKESWLDGGREVWLGFHQSVQPSQWKMMLNIDVSATPFYRKMPVIEFMAEVLELHPLALTDRRPITDAQRLKFTKEIRALKVEVTHCGAMRRKYRVCNVTRRPAQLQTFPLTLENGRSVDCMVANYFFDKYNIALKYPHLPCLQVEPEQRNIYLPLEVCELVGGQRSLKKLTDNQTKVLTGLATEKSAYERERKIIDVMRKAEFSQDAFVHEFGLSIQPVMTELKGHVLEKPELLYKQGSKATRIDKTGKWDMIGKRFREGVEVKVWAIVCFAPREEVSTQHLERFSHELQGIGNHVGMPFIGRSPCFCKYASGVDQVEPIFKYLKANYAGLQLVCVVLPGPTNALHAEVKRVGETLLGMAARHVAGGGNSPLATQCIQMKNVAEGESFRRQTVLSNLCLKINVKLGGINFILAPALRPQICNEPVLFVGACVSHPPVGDKGQRPSIAAAVGSLDGHPSRYAATVRVQAHRQALLQEFIGDLALMIKELLICFYRSTHYKPVRIVLYRTGVREAQFMSVLQHELRSMREACMMLDRLYQPGITFIAVQRRHHTRLFAVERSDQVGRANNIPPGTTVDVGITHPSNFDFYLCSHAGDKGTSRPAYYRVLWDDNDLSADELQKLTYQLCHTQARCTRSVPVPAPACYADLVSSRAREHLVEYKENDSGEGSQPSAACGSQNLASMGNAIQVHPDSEMYFV